MLFCVLHRTSDTSPHEKVDCCAVVQHDHTAVDLHAVIRAVVVQTVQSCSQLLVRPLD